MSSAKATARPAQRPIAVTVIGAGGNTGSQFVLQLARLPDVQRALLVDGDTYDEGNLHSQSIYPREVGRAKALVQQHRLRQLMPHAVVEAIVGNVQDVPLGRLKADVIVACVDSRQARLSINEIAWRLGIPWIDTAIDAAGLLARCTVYVPGADAPCIECGWNEQDYLAVEQTYACHAGRASAPSTNAPSSLGGVAAAYAASECSKLLRASNKMASERGTVPTIGPAEARPTVPGSADSAKSGQSPSILLDALSKRLEHVACGQEILFDLRHHRQSVTRLRRNRQCRFDHETWVIRHVSPAPSRMSLGRFLKRLEAAAQIEMKSLRVSGHSFARRLVCPHCGAPTADLLCLNHRIPRTQWLCTACGARRAPIGFETSDWLSLEGSESRWRQRTLHSIGLRAGDVVTVAGPGGEFHFELALTAVNTRPANTGRAKSKCR